MFNFINIYSFIPVSRYGPQCTALPGAYNAVKTALMIILAWKHGQRVHILSHKNLTLIQVINQEN